MFTHTLYGGQHDQWIVAFYGFGQRADVYEPLYEIIRHTHNLIVIDLPMAADAQKIKPLHLKSYLNDLMAQNNIKKIQAISYSMGSRFNLYLPILFPNIVSKIVLIAPDGITFNFWNRVAVSTPWGRRLFHFFVKNGEAYIKTLTFFHKIGVVNKSLFAFSKWNMRDRKRRDRVYYAWMNSRYFRPSLKQVNAACINNEIIIVSYFGEQDVVIPKAYYNKCKRRFPQGHHYLIQSDHQMLKKEFFSLLSKEISK